jgi:hypothetical protein
MTANKPTDTESAPAEPNTAAPEPSQIPETQDEAFLAGETGAVPPAPAAPTPAAPPVAAAPVIPEMDRVLWKQETASDYVEFTEPAIVTFLTNNFAAIPATDGSNRNSYELDVLQEIDGEQVSKILGFRSKRLLRLLMKPGVSPLYGKRLMISRAGEGFATQYTVKVLQ